MYSYICIYEYNVERERKRECERCIHKCIHIEEMRGAMIFSID